MYPWYECIPHDSFVGACISALVRNGFTTEEARRQFDDLWRGVGLLSEEGKVADCGDGLYWSRREAVVRRLSALGITL